MHANEILPNHSFLRPWNRSDTDRGPIYGSGVSGGEKRFLHPVLFPLERLIYRVTGVQPDLEMTLAQLSLGRRHLYFIRFISLFTIFEDAAVASSIRRARPKPELAPGVQTRRGASPATPTRQSIPAEGVMTIFPRPWGFRCTSFSAARPELRVLAAVGRAVETASVKKRSAVFWTAPPAPRLYL